MQWLFIAYVYDEILRNANHIHMAFDTLFLENFLNEIHRINEFVSKYGAFYSFLLDIGIVDLIVLKKSMIKLSNRAFTK